jgi:hypothetical protein
VLDSLNASYNSDLYGHINNVSGHINNYDTLKIVNVSIENLTTGYKMFAELSGDFSFPSNKLIQFNNTIVIIPNVKAGYKAVPKEIRISPFVM